MDTLPLALAGHAAPLRERREAIRPVPPGQCTIWNLHFKCSKDAGRRHRGAARSIGSAAAAASGLPASSGGTHAEATAPSGARPRGPARDRVGVVFSGGHLEGPGEVTKTSCRRRSSRRASRRARKTSETLGGVEAGEGDAKTILFGDLHVHIDVLRRRLHAQPAARAGAGRASAGRRLRLRALLQRPRLLEHQRPRRVDLAEALARHQEAIRQCNAVAGDPKNRTWSRSSAGSGRRSARRRRITTATKNVIFKDTGEDRVPKRRSAPRAARSHSCSRASRCASVSAWSCSICRTASATSTSASTRPICARRRSAGRASTRKAPDDCMETAGSPHELFEARSVGLRLAGDPHGTTWGLSRRRARRSRSSSPAKENDPTCSVCSRSTPATATRRVSRQPGGRCAAPTAKLQCAEPTDKFLPMLLAGRRADPRALRGHPRRSVRAARVRVAARTTSRRESPGMTVPGRAPRSGRTAASAATASAGVLDASRQLGAVRARDQQLRRSRRAQSASASASSARATITARVPAPATRSTTAAR